MSQEQPPVLTQTQRIQALLDGMRRGDVAAVDRTNQVYCNRDLNLQKVETIGFDMDYTLARYHQDELDALSVRLTLERLVRERGYPSEILDFKPRPDFAIRGLIIDTWHGNVLKLDAHRHVGKGYHGFRELTEDERAYYRDETIRFNGDTDRYWLIDTLFALPEAYMYAALVDYLETSETERDHDWKRLFRDIRYCIDLAHRDGSIKDAIMGDMDRYIESQDEALALTLHKFRSAGKRLFLLTNSFPVYSSAVMAHVLDGVLEEYPSWKNYFDIIIAGSSKPSFFTDRAPFLIADEAGEIHGEEYQTFERGVIYQGGNLIDFERIAGCSGERVVYIGDHIYGDIVRSKKSSAWRTVMIVQEMEAELERASQLREDRASLDEIDLEILRVTQQITFEQNIAYRLNGLVSEAQGDELVLLQRALREVTKNRDDLRRLRRDLLSRVGEAEDRLEEHFNSYWGLIFRLANENTLFGEQVEDYACLYTSRVANFVSYSPLHYYRAPRQLMPHERY